MPRTDMSAAAVTTRLKRVSQLRRLGMSLQKATIKPAAESSEVTAQHTEQPRKPGKRRVK